MENEAAAAAEDKARAEAEAIRDAKARSSKKSKKSTKAELAKQLEEANARATAGMEQSHYQENQFNFKGRLLK